MNDLAVKLGNWGVAANRIHTKIFGSNLPKTPGIAAAPRAPRHQPAGSTGVGPLVSFARSGLNVHWSTAFQSLTELAEACDVPVRWACRSGVCHTCETGLISGSVIYRQDPVEPPAEGNALICCSQPQRRHCSRSLTRLKRPLAPGRSCYAKTILSSWLL
jgi:ferredoxin